MAAIENVPMGVIEEATDPSLVTPQAKRRNGVTSLSMGAAPRGAGASVSPLGVSVV